MRISDWSSDVCSSDLSAEDGAAVVPRAAENQHDPDEEGGDHRIDGFRRDRAVEVGEKSAAEAHQAGAENEGLQAAEGDVLAERGGRRLVVADGPHHAAPGRTDRKSVVSGKSVSVRVDLGGRRIIKKKKQQ